MRAAAWARVFVVGGALAALTCAAPDALAQKPTNKSRQQALKLGGEALDLFQAGDYEAALDKFTRADELVPAPTLKLHIARCLDKLDRMQDAADKFRDVIATELKAWAPAVHRKARKQAVPELAALLEEVPTVSVTVEGPGSADASVSMDGEPLPAESLGEKRAMDPGHYRFEADSGGRTTSEEIDLGRGDNVRVTLTFKPVGDPDTDDPIYPGGEDKADGDTYRIAGFIGIGIGGAGLVMGTVAGIVVLNQEGDLEARCADRQCLPPDHEDAEAFDTARTVSTAGFIIGGIGLAAGITLLLIAPDDDEAELEEVTVYPMLSPTGLGLWGRF